VLEAGKGAVDPRATLEKMRDSVDAFVERRRKYLLYEEGGRP